MWSDAGSIHFRIFAIEPHGQVYERMMNAQTICFYAPSAFTNLKLELMAVLK